ncbi:serine/threonine protein kinase [Streptomyces sp. NPDC059618]|uniref:protein kinase domain-containing protein n=1 Tax=Streptomyces sp. NPDC059618 TaxID=3346887 RepID=UPI00368F5AEE
MAKAQDSAGELIAGRYRLLDVFLREEGRALWHGEDSAFGRPVVLARSRAAGEPDGEAAEPAADRILRTAKLLGPACNGGVAAVLDVAEEPGFVWTVTERPPGAPLTELLRDGPVDHVWAAAVGLRVLDVLTAAHSEGVVHGELGPSQVWADEHGAVTVTGFGATPAGAAHRVTTPSYASPEQARGEATTPAADLWTLGAMMYALVEGRPLVQERDSAEATFRAVDRLPVKEPRQAGPLAPAILGLLRWDPVERVPEAVVREALTRILRQNFEEVTPPEPLPDLLGPVGDHRGGGAEGEGAGPSGPGREGLPAGRPLLLGAALTVTVAAVGAFVLMGGLPGGDATSASGPAPSRAAAGTPTAAPSSAATPAGRTPTPSSKPSPSPSAGAGTALPSGFSLYRAPQGFAVALPTGWKPVETQSSDDLAYRVTFGAAGDPRTLAVTYSTQLGPDPVAVWSALEPSLRAVSTGYERVGAIQPVTYHGMKGADMEWYSVSGGVRVRTLGRGFLIGDHRGFSLRWTTPADDWDSATNRQALKAIFDSFRTGVK